MPVIKVHLIWACQYRMYVPCTERDAHTEDGVDPPKGRLQGRRGEKVAAPIPANVLNAVEVIGDLGNGRRDDGLIEGNEEHGEAEGHQDHGQLGAVWVVDTLVPVRSLAFCCWRVWLVRGGILLVVACLRGLLGALRRG